MDELCGEKAEDEKNNYLFYYPILIIHIRQALLICLYWQKQHIMITLLNIERVEFMIRTPVNYPLIVLYIWYMMFIVQLSILLNIDKISVLFKKNGTHALMQPVVDTLKGVVGSK